MSEYKVQHRERGLMRWRVVGRYAPTGHWFLVANFFTEKAARRHLSNMECGRWRDA